ILCSRPCNPTGNIITDDELKSLISLAKSHDIPLIVDSAYAPPFPNLVYSQMTPLFDEHLIHCVSLSKAGLPGERVAFAIGHEKYISAIEPFYSNAGIHSSRFGQAIAARALTSDRLATISEQVIKPFYGNKLELFRKAMHEHMPEKLAWYLHKVEGSLFAWLWVNHEKMNDLEMYQKLKAESLIVVPGSTFFPGLRASWPHKSQCLRISMTASDEDIVAATKALGTVLSKL
ncbi:MAG: aminotransferase class I/II-fold pyridoxal phosphate-dependent enzyme, partial [Bdellovibrionales bacterium]|nr:aminotransferase class I/II-fold pyridoxal phosphate-dependent enzyme [Bdellovibrionales bacterium]